MAAVLIIPKDKPKTARGRPWETGGGSSFVARLREVRADGVVTPEESESVVRMMDVLLAQDR